MELHGTMEINDEGILEIGGCEVNKIAEEYGTPLYILDEKEIRDNCRAYRKAFEEWYPNSETIYASKAFMSLTMCRIVDEEGLGLDVVSGGELYTALEADFPVEKIYFHGNNKTPEELEMALEAGIGRIVVDNNYELELLNGIAAEKDKVVDILIRVTPGVEAHTHSYIQTGQTDSKFGVGIQNGLALETIKNAIKLDNISVKGIHCHIGSQIFNLESFGLAVDVMLDFVEDVKEEADLVMEELNLGGGIGIKYTEDDQTVDINEYAKIVSQAIQEKCDELEIPLPKVINEPGRSIIGTAGSTIYTVGSIKQIPDIRKYVAVDGGMPDNIRPALYDAEYEAIVVNKADQETEEVVSITGKCCESGDMLIWDIELPELESGDILLVSCTGAYGYSMANNYNSLPKPGVVLVNDGQVEEIIRREQYQDLVAKEEIPAKLKGNN
ncbi:MULTISPECIES: diaminopimelate decarboxylase [unclassified Candidatus Frackibacter]|uniref:diaminopimelate decarboxylase n=1 Tax=unclassified Candidatus Frackibacter TaxID=2648818 RepID=UPI00079455E4|nr:MULTISPECIES: diaminopimelate decarboxylase [unclassified Candidatus Frackibacter]KXS43780.1 MAG: diaminopimelate decarboxylase [Candidatus Frackibacter sp. T328-2]SDC01440.1 diaminopimelate decarboxylase [Candidatus Frackibacter sp. WG11]SEM32665.1 diaminopimelate decarboxylase [Candidatus Frackibacter sp. WG12]SFL37637.1 diaminopimelate decarboxylase [Candidatus Frackibacter sp. WG13]